LKQGFDFAGPAARYALREQSALRVPDMDFSEGEVRSTTG
jgi:hypothetical protein